MGKVGGLANHEAQGEKGGGGGGGGGFVGSSCMARWGKIVLGTELAAFYPLQEDAWLGS